MPKIPSVAQQYDVDSIIALWETRFNVMVNKADKVIRSEVLENGRRFTLRIHYYGNHPRLVVVMNYQPEKTHGAEIEIESYIHMGELVIEPSARGGGLTYHEMRVLAAVCVDLSPAFADMESILITHVRNSTVTTYFNAPFNEIERTYYHEHWVAHAVLYGNSYECENAADLELGIEPICKAIHEQYGAISDSKAIRQKAVDAIIDCMINHILDGYGLTLTPHYHLLRLFALKRLSAAADAHVKEVGSAAGLTRVLADAVVELWANLKLAR